MIGKSLLSLMLLLGISLTSFGELSAQSVNWQILISGNSKTKTGIIQNITRKCLQDQGNENKTKIQSSLLRECILNSQFFSEVDVTIDSNRINIHVDERISLIPIPMIQGGDGEDTSYGLLVVESNLLGLGKTLVVGGTYSDSRAMGLLLYQDPELFGTPWTLDLTLYKEKRKNWYYEGEKEVYGIDESVVAKSLQIGYQLTSNFEAAFLYQNVEKSYDTFDNYRRPDDYKPVNIGFKTTWSQSQYKFYYQEGFDASLIYNQQISRGGDDTEKAKRVILEAGWQQPFYEDQVLQLTLSGAHLDGGDVRDYFRLGTTPGFRGIQEQGAWANNYLAISADYQVPIKTFESGTWTFAPFVDAGSLKTDVRESERINYTAYGVGTYFYLKKIMVPGIGFVIGRNSEYQETFYNFTLGFSI